MAQPCRVGKRTVACLRSRGSAPRASEGRRSRRVARGALLVLPLLAMACGPAVPKVRILKGPEGREYRLLAPRQQQLKDGSLAMVFPYETQIALSDLGALRREASALSQLLRLDLGDRGKRVAILQANSEPAGAWDPTRQKYAFYFEVSEGGWTAIKEGVIR